MSSSSPAAHLNSALAGRYMIDRELGQGGMATVYLAEDVRHRRKVALKVLHPELSAVLGTERFLKEIELTASLQHPHILPLFDSGDADGQLYYVMPLVDGETLRARLEREKQLPITDALRIAGEVADALHYAHDRRVIHRDIKPENILLQGGHALVADFGIALAVQQAGGQRMTQTGLSLGTPQYMAPEQAMGDKAIDARVDVYALGAVVYEMLAGEPPFTGPTAQAIVAKVLSADPQPLTVLRRAVPAHVDVAVRRALEKLPADRFGSAEDFARALREPEAASISRERWPVAPERQRSATMGVLAALLLVASIAAIWGWARNGSAAGASAGVASFTSIDLTGVPTSGAGNNYFAVSPDGRHVAIAVDGVEGVSLRLRSLNSLGFRSLPGTAGATYPFWSPDSRTLAFFDGDSLRALNVASGTTRALCAVRDARGGTWGTDGTILVGTSSSGILRRPSSGSPCAPFIPSRDGALAWIRPYFFPDGRHFLATTGNRAFIGRTDRDTLAFLTDLSVMEGVLAAPDILLRTDPTDHTVSAQRIDPERAQLVGDPVTIFGDVPNGLGRPGLSASASGVLVTSVIGPMERGQTSLTALRWIARGGAAVGRQSWPTNNFTSMRPSRDGRRLAMGGWTLTVRDSTRDERVGGSAEAFRDVSRTPHWMPGDTAIVYQRYFFTASRAEIVQLASGAIQTLFMPDTGRLLQLYDVSADGRRIAYRWAPPAGQRSSEALEYDVATGKSQQLFEGPAEVHDLRYAPFGAWVAYESGRNHEIFLRLYPGLGTPTRIATVGRQPRWRGDGRELYYLASDGSVMAVGVGPRGVLGPATIAVPSSAFASEPVGSFEPAADGQRFLFDVRRPTRSLTFVQNWPALIKGKQ